MKHVARSRQPKLVRVLLGGRRLMPIALRGEIDDNDVEAGLAGDASARGYSRGRAMPIALMATPTLEPHIRPCGMWAERGRDE